MKGSRSVKRADSVKSSSPATTVWRPAVRMGCSEYSVTLVIFHSLAFVLLGHRSLLNQHASGGLPSGIGTCIDFEKSIPHVSGGEKDDVAGGARISWGEATRETSVSCSVKSGTVGIPWRGSSDANLTLEANKHMQAELRQPKSETDMAALYGRRERVVSPIRSLERYQRARVRHIQSCPRREPPAAA